MGTGASAYNGPEDKYEELEKTTTCEFFLSSGPLYDLCASLSHGLSTALSCARLNCNVHGQQHDLRGSFHAPVAVNRKQLQRLWKRFNLLDSTGNGIITRCKPHHARSLCLFASVSLFPLVPSY